MRAGQRFRSRYNEDNSGRLAASDEQDSEPEATAAEPAPQAGAVTAEEHNRRGQKSFENDDIEGAIREFESAVKMAPDNPSYHCNLAVAYDENEQDDLALAEYEKTLGIDPDDVTALLSLGYCITKTTSPPRPRKSGTGSFR